MNALEIPFRDLLEAAPDAMLLVDGGGVIRLVNHETERMFGWSREELVGQPIERLVPARYRDHHAQARGDAGQGLARRPMHARVGLVALRKDGTEFAADIGLAPVATSAGESVIASVRDVTDRVRLEKRLQEANRQRAAQIALLGTVTDLLRPGDAGAPNLRDLLAATVRGAGMSKAALYVAGPDGALRLQEAIGFGGSPPGAVEGWGALLAGRAAGGEVARWSAESHEPHARALVDAAGVVSLLLVPLEVEGRRAGAMLLGAGPDDQPSEDAAVFARAIGHQMTQSLELSRAFRGLAASELRYRTLMERASDAIAILTEDGRIREVNRRAAEILGQPADLLVGKTVADLPALDEPDNVGSAWAALLDGRGTPGPVRMRRPDGNHVLVEFSAQAVDVGGERLVMAVGRDVTEQVRAREQLMISDRMASIGTLAAGVAHEINNPLTAVVANLELAEQDVASLLVGSDATALSEVVQMHRDAREAAERVRDIVRDLKVFSRSDEDRTGPVDVHRVLDSSARMARNEIRHSARVVREYGEIPLVHGNASRLGQVFLNLLVNAAQAIPEGHADHNAIRLRTRTDPQGRAVIEISDTGTGMSEATQRRLFTPFFTTKAPGVGTGLGLAIVKRIVTGLGGEVAVTSALGRGTTFTVTLLPSQGEDAETAPPSAPTAAPRRGRVLVIDDEESLGSAIRRALGREHDVSVVSQAHDALRRIESGEDFDVVLCDLMMPVMTGMDLHEALLRLAPAHARRMVFVTGGGFTARARAFLDEVPNARLDKPFDLQALRALVNERVAAR